ncbi:unnamed protein product [Macrosiphum euphorbiae]|uniref:protein-serine/threonine phosphatase n=1 Tax=Macrosiphum euphorbiae TaxID=13131 RepID=A0AAV0XAN4_9HEMI|nr:unnamed protein product [Macrosiphum euphorbiae]
MTDIDELLKIDNIISRLLEVRGARPGKKVQLSDGEMMGLCLKSREIFLSQPMLLKLDAQLKTCGKQRYNIKLWKVFTDCLRNYLPVAAIVEEEIFCCHGGLSPNLQSMDQIRQIMRPTDVPDQGLLCDLLWSDPDKDTMGWRENDDSVSFILGAAVVRQFLHKHDFDFICRAHEVFVEDGFELFAEDKLVTLFSAPSYLRKFGYAGAMMLCSFQILKV